MLVAMVQDAGGLKLRCRYPCLPNEQQVFRNNNQTPNRVRDEPSPRAQAKPVILIIVNHGLVAELEHFETDADPPAATEGGTRAEEEIVVVVVVVETEAERRPDPEIPCKTAHDRHLPSQHHGRESSNLARVNDESKCCKTEKRH
mmetsp:Transcript_21198/g.36176  ORF Transcript_21198/g.36176 Transcript_21198/m.36176 type:complete len:145 (+) Transcript_21198:733-1167(+)